jgi:hypothetical protein
MAGMITQMEKWHLVNKGIVQSFQWETTDLNSVEKQELFTSLEHLRFLMLIFFSFLFCPNVATGPSWSWSYGSWIYNYLCNKWLSPPTMWVRIPLRRGVLDTTLYVIKFVSHLRQVGRFLWFPLSIKLSGTI